MCIYAICPSPIVPMAVDVDDPRNRRMELTEALMHRTSVFLTELNKAKDSARVKQTAFIIT